MWMGAAKSTRLARQGWEPNEGGAADVSADLAFAATGDEQDGPYSRRRHEFDRPGATTADRCGGGLGDLPARVVENRLGRQDGQQGRAFGMRVGVLVWIGCQNPASTA